MVTRNSPDGRRSWPVTLRSKLMMSSPMRSASSHHLLAAGGERIAGAAALEQARAELLLDLGKPPEHGGMIDAEAVSRARKRTRFGDRLDVAEVVPRQHAAATIRRLRNCKRSFEAVCVQEASERGR